MESADGNTDRLERAIDGLNGRLAAALALISTDPGLSPDRIARARDILQRMTAPYRLTAGFETDPLHDAQHCLDYIAQFVGPRPPS